MIRNLFEGWHGPLLIIVLVLLFGAKRLPDAARGLGRSLRIFKAETEGLRTDSTPPPPLEANPATVPPATIPLAQQPVQQAAPQQPDA